MPSKTEVAISVGLLMAMLGLLWEFSSLRQYRQSPHNTQRSTRTDLMYSNTTAVILQTFRSELEDAKQELLEAKSRLNKQEKSMQKLSKLKEEIQNTASSKQRDLENQVAKLEQQMGKLLETNKKGMVPAQQQPQQIQELQPQQQQQQQRQEQQETETGQQVTKKAEKTNENWWLADRVPLLPWELESITGKCNPPDGIPEICCSRSTTKGSGQPVAFRPDLCTTDTKRYENVAEKTLEYLQEHPVDGMGCDVCRIIQVMQEQNWKTLVVVGDSMTRQTFAGFQCELLRRGYEMKTKVEGDLADPRKGLRYGIRQRKTLTLTKIPGSPKSSKMVDIKIIFYIMYWPTAGSIDQFILGPGTDVYIFDHSLWYRHWEMPKFLEGMTALLKQLTTASMPPKMIMWREQSAQHFNRPGGSYSPKGPEMVPGVDGCVPIHDYTAKYQHVQVMKNATERAGMNFVDPHQQQLEQPPATGPSSLSLSNSKNLYFIPFRDFSSQFHDIHRDGECTHYCSTPDLWLPISRGIRIHMDNYNHLQGQNAASDVRS